MKNKKKLGFTLVEMMMVVVVLGIIAGIGSSKFGNILRNAREGQTRSNLGLLRSALNIYFSDNLAWFPVAATGANQTTLEDTLVPKYLRSIPQCYVYPYHEPSTSVDNIPSSDFFAADPTEDGEWVYVSVYSNQDWGLVGIESYQNDSKGQIWSGY